MNHCTVKELKQTCKKRRKCKSTSYFHVGCKCNRAFGASTDK